MDSTVEHKRMGREAERVMQQREWCNTSSLFQQLFSFIIKSELSFDPNYSLILLLRSATKCAFKGPTHTHTRTKFKRKGICCQHSYIHWWFQLVRITFSSWFIVNAHSSIASIKWHSYGIAGPLHPGKCPAPVCSMYRPINVCSIFFSYCIIHIRSQRVSFQFEILGRSISLVECGILTNLLNEIWSSERTERSVFISWITVFIRID